MSSKVRTVAGADHDHIEWSMLMMRVSCLQSRIITFTENLELQFQLHNLTACEAAVKCTITKVASPVKYFIYRLCDNRRDGFQSVRYFIWQSSSDRAAIVCD